MDLRKLLSLIAALLLILIACVSSFAVSENSLIDSGDPSDVGKSTLCSSIGTETSTCPRPLSCFRMFFFAFFACRFVILPAPTVSKSIVMG